MYVFMHIDQAIQVSFPTAFDEKIKFFNMHRSCQHFLYYRLETMFQIVVSVYVSQKKGTVILTFHSVNKYVRCT